mmetsp:Transcript_92074/g.231527  ORF Transcript_92074/g.231527 Transcript_92074/m.231527 type:complete len:250 (+) Transcript_92074:1304-2053(+)
MPGPGQASATCAADRAPNPHRGTRRGTSPTTPLPPRRRPRRGRGCGCCCCRRFCRLRSARPACLRSPGTAPWPDAVAQPHRHRHRWRPRSAPALHAGRNLRRRPHRAEGQRPARSEGGHAAAPNDRQEGPPANSNRTGRGPVAQASVFLRRPRVSSLTPRPVPWPEEIAGACQTGKRQAWQESSSSPATALSAAQLPGRRFQMKSPRPRRYHRRHARGCDTTTFAPPLCSLHPSSEEWRLTPNGKRCCS